MLAEGALRRTVGRGATLVRQGRRGEGLCLILSGRAVVLRGRTVVASLGPGDFFGEIGLLTGTRATATVKATEVSELVLVDRLALEGAVGLDPDVGHQLLLVLLARVDEAGATAPPAWSRGLTAVGRLAGYVGFARPALRSPAARRWTEAFPSLLGLPAALAEALGDLGLAPGQEGAGPGLVLQPSGLHQGELSEHPQQWRLPDAAIDELFARSPEALRFLGPLAARS